MVCVRDLITVYIDFIIQAVQITLIKMYTYNLQVFYLHCFCLTKKSV